MTTRVRQFLQSRWPELLLMALGLALRISMLVTYDVRSGYDFSAHWDLVIWYRDTFDFPPLTFSPETYHPPLYYVVSGLLAKFNDSTSLIAALSVLFGCVRLAIIWLGLELYIPGRTMARRVALALAAVIASSIHLEGMVTGESLNNLLAVVELVLIPPVFRAEGRRRVALGALLGSIAALHMLTKVSAMAIVGAVGAGALLELFLRKDWRRFAGLATGLAIVVAGSGWYFARNVELYGKAFLHGWEGMDPSLMMTWNDVPYWKRRPPSFVIGWSVAPYKMPYWPAGVSPESRFFPVLITSAFVDYYNFHFGTPRGCSGPTITVNGEPLRESVVLPSRLAAVAASWIALITFLSWCFAFRFALRRHDVALATVLLVPLLAAIGQLHLAVSYPVDSVGPVKGLYMQFAAPPLHAVFGLGVATLWSRKLVGIALTLVSLSALGLVGFYSVFSRFC